MPVAYNVGRVTVNSASAPVRIVASRVGRISLRLFVDGHRGSFLQVGPSNAITIANSYPLPIGENLVPNTEGEVWGVGLAFDVSFLETF